MLIRRIVDWSLGYSELANPRSRILIKLYGGDDYTEFGAPAQPTSATTAQALMDHLAVGPAGSQAPASLASSVAQPVSARWRHLPSSTTDTTLIDVSGSQLAKKNTRGPCRQLKMAKVTRVTNSRINIGYDERHQAAPTAELHSSLTHDIGHVVRSHCPMKWKS
ncbi:hypothetical protein Prudu_862S000600 [Prunus dulcis]|uniref:Uncharacterized protein n=1 Tax=Prunus dulcis TaxID=3755 RepID=A0A5H2XRA1_PRUDU|nr:hypothetical protein Prudu_862S000600 [Prunus dulcis]